MTNKYKQAPILKMVRESAIVNQQAFSSFCKELSNILQSNNQLIQEERYQINKYGRLIMNELNANSLIIILFKYSLQISKITDQNRKLKGIKSNVKESAQECSTQDSITRLQEYLIKIRNLEESLHQERQIFKDNSQKLLKQLESVKLEYQQKMNNLIHNLNDFCNSAKLNRSKQIQILKLKLTQLENQNQIKILNQVEKVSLFEENEKKQERKIEELRYTHENDEKQMKKLQILKEKAESKSAKLQQQINNLQSELDNYRNSLQLKKEEHLKLFLQKITQYFPPNQISTKEQFINHIKFASRQLLCSSQILYKNTQIRTFLTQQIEEISKKTISGTKLRFKYDQYHTNCGPYLDTEEPFLIIFKLANGRVCGGYCPGLKVKSASLLFTFLNKGKVFHKRKQCQDQLGCSYVNNCLTFGRSELVLMNYKKQFRLNTNSFGEKYFKLQRQIQFYEDDNSNIIKFQQMEIHSIIFDLI